VKWDEPVRTWLPGFSLSRPELNALVTVRDLVSHRIGFGLGAGDLLFWPNGDRTRAEIMAAVAHVPIEDQFRARYHYCNLMFVVAGEVVAAASGMSWEAFVQTRILDRLGMVDTLPVMVDADPAKCALPHGRVGPPLRYLGPMTRIGASVLDAADSGYRLNVPVRTVPGTTPSEPRGPVTSPQVCGEAGRRAAASLLRLEVATSAGPCASRDGLHDGPWPPGVRQIERVVSAVAPATFVPELTKEKECRLFFFVKKLTSDGERLCTRSHRLTKLRPRKGTPAGDPAPSEGLPHFFIE